MCACIICHEVTGPEAATGEFAGQTGPICTDCAYWSDGNVSTEGGQR
ncbi:MAG: hypothetical protein ACRDTZ_22810 [Pseudonocardiaceae bacterium]